MSTRGFLDDVSLLAAGLGAPGPGTTETGEPALEPVVAAHLAADPDGPVGHLLVPDERLLELAALLEHAAPDGPERPVRLAVVATGGAGSVEPALRWAERCPGTTLGYAVATLRDRGDLGGAARRTVAAAQDAGCGQLRVVVPVEEAGRPGFGAALDELAAAEAVVVLGADGSVPSRTLAEALEAALDRELAVSLRLATSGEAADGPGRPGTLAPLPALRAAWDGEGPDRVAAILDETDPEVLRSLAAEHGEDALARTRRLLPSLLVPGLSWSTDQSGQDRT